MPLKPGHYSPRREAWKYLSSPGAVTSKFLDVGLAKVTYDHYRVPKPLAYPLFHRRWVTQDILTTPGVAVGRLRTCRPAGAREQLDARTEPLAWHRPLRNGERQRPFPGRLPPGFRFPFCTPLHHRRLD